jgi:1,4-dihydroxy-2-naphthoate octaprenyltransferase
MLTGFCVGYSTLAILPWSALLTWLSLPLTYLTARIVLTRTGSALNAALAQTGQLALLFSLLFLISVFF